MWSSLLETKKCARFLFSQNENLCSNLPEIKEKKKSKSIFVHVISGLFRYDNLKKVINIFNLNEKYLKENSLCLIKNVSFTTIEVFFLYFIIIGWWLHDREMSEYKVHISNIMLPQVCGYIT